MNAGSQNPCFARAYNTRGNIADINNRKIEVIFGI